MRPGTYGVADGILSRVACGSFTRPRTSDMHPRAMAPTHRDLGEPKRPRIFCPGCAREREGCSGWYHAACYWRQHRACLKLPI